MSKFKSKKVLALKNMPTRLPIWPTITCVLALDYWNAPQWLYGTMGLFFLIVWISSIARLVMEKDVDILNDNNK